MIEIEKTVIKLAVIEDMLRTVKPVIDTARGKVRTWLKSMTKPDATIEEAVHVYLQISEATKETVPDYAAVEQEFAGLVRAGGYTHAELQDLVAKGLLVLADPQAAVAIVGAKIRGYTPPTKVDAREATDPDSAPLKILAKPGVRFDGLRTAVRGVGDIRPIVNRILEAPLPTPVVPQGKVLVRVKKK